MTPQASLQITDPAAARALRQHHAFLGLFVQPQSPSEVAARAGMAANLVHHHARRLTDCGLLFEQRREGGRVYFQLAAREFRVPMTLLPPGDAQGNGTADLQDLSDGFLRAYERSWALVHDGEEDVYGFGDAHQPAPPMTPPDAPSPEGHPAHLDRLTLHLSPQRYRQLARALSALLEEAQTEGHSAGGVPCTLAVLAFRAEDTPHRSLSRAVNSFLGADPA
ncbi:winged helix-turn-helix domain-containing protein [Deinococcus multiflagellatus]|uniref:Winged helix-turn-helix domain-containing protein n=1 Tax=Deinococcus multiflagellatus TaxID=1656887 RepID=A0ABW1ZL95_9DEIO|nr:winged helix-turn-helix domain-containing protein [Deinococcus multiflagellatus]MBZ9713378.1 winged helix-turn-helix domain-containing protein [Deinococcus multiflagellatus]